MTFIFFKMLSHFIMKGGVYDILNNVLNILGISIVMARGDGYCLAYSIVIWYILQCPRRNKVCNKFNNIIKILNSSIDRESYHQYIQMMFMDVFGGLIDGNVLDPDDHLTNISKNMGINIILINGCSKLVAELINNFKDIYESLELNDLFDYIRLMHLSNNNEYITSFSIWPKIENITYKKTIMILYYSGHFMPCIPINIKKDTESLIKKFMELTLHENLLNSI